jgi:hypothetical protein
MTAADIRLLDGVALTADRPSDGLRRGDVGTVVEILAPGMYEVEFSDNQGRAYAFLLLRDQDLTLLTPTHDAARPLSTPGPLVIGADQGRCSSP